MSVVMWYLVIVMSNGESGQVHTQVISMGTEERRCLEEVFHVRKENYVRHAFCVKGGR